jgi:beta-N-acetylhexosaminidase
VHRKHLALVGLTLLACRPTPPTGPAPLGAPPGSGAPVDIEALLDTLPLRDRVAQLVMPWIPGTYASQDDPEFRRTLAWVDSLHVGGLLVSIGSPLDVAAKLNLLQQRSPLPLLVGSDLESGTSFRLVGGTPFPPNMGVAAGGGESAAYDIGTITAHEARAVGIQITFSPDADVNSNPANPIINLRSFGEDPRAVSRLVAAAVRGIQEHGMLATAKHFPGHGDTDIDTHLGLPTSPATWARLDSTELLPFRAAIGAGVAAVMSAHIELPAIDPGVRRPGTLSPVVQTGILRDSLGFRGLVLTDALNMGSLTRNYPAATAAVQAFLAGADILLQPADPAQTIDALVAAVRDGRISRERLDRSLRRVLESKRDLGLFARRTVSLDSVTARVGRAEDLARAREIAAQGIVLAEDRDGTLDSLRARPQPVAVVSYGDDRSPYAGLTLVAELKARGYTASSFRLSPGSGPASYDSARTVAAGAPIAVFAISIRPSGWRPNGVTLPAALARLVNESARAGRAILLSEGTPYMVLETPAVSSYLLAWASDPVSEAAAASALAGEAAIGGRLPTSIPPRYRLGAGLQRGAAPGAARP